MAARKTSAPPGRPPGRPKNPGPAGDNINIRFNLELLAQIDARAAALSAEHPGLELTRADIVRMALAAFLGVKPAKSAK